MSRLVETIRAEDGKLQNIDFHNERLIRSLHAVFGIKTAIDLEKIITIPETAKRGIFKCRVEYDMEIRKIEFLTYAIKPIKSLKLIEDNNIDYRFKFTDRTAIERLMTNREECDDILIVKNGYVTDSSYANLIFKTRSGNWITPSTYLLQGTRRTSLLKHGVITEAAIRSGDIQNYTEVRLINSMIGINETVGIPVCNII
jgi:4-amino-4-deoxychorismate lyase